MWSIFLLSLHSFEIVLFYQENRDSGMCFILTKLFILAISQISCLNQSCRNFLSININGT